MGVAEEENTSRQKGEEDPLVGDEETRGRDEGGTWRAGQLGGVCATGRVRGSRPARRSGRSVKKRMNSNIDVM